MRLKKHSFQFLALFGRWINWVHWLVLAGSLGFTYQIHEWQKSQIRNEWRLKFDAEVRKVPHLIEARLEYNLQMLKGVAGLLGASANVDRRGFRNYTEAVLGQNTGVLGLSFSPIVPNVGKDQYETAVRRSGLLDFRIHPQGTREFYTPVQYLEPQSGANLRALGYDIYSDSVRRTAMVSARDSGAGTITSKILLVQDGKESPQAGALLLYPVYDKGMPIDTLDARRSSIVGWVAAPFHMHVLLGNLLGASGTEIDIEIYDGENIAGDKLIYDDDPEYDLQVANEVVGFQSTQRIVVGGRTWMVQTGSKPGFLEQQGGYGHLNTFFIAGAIASLLLTLLVYILAIARRRAIAKTQELSVDLDNSLLAEREQFDRFRTIFDTVKDAIITIDAKGCITNFNLSATRIFGYQVEEVIGRNVKMLMPEGEDFRRAHDDPTEAYLTDVVSKIVGKKGGSVELVAMRKDGGTFHVELTLNERRSNNESSFTGVLRDISERKRLEAESKRIQQQSEFKFDKHIARIINAMAQGDLTQKVVLGDAGETPRQREIFENINAMADQLNRFSSEVTRVAREVGTEGVLGGQAEVPGVAGTWQELTENVNAMAESLTVQVRAIAAVTTAVAGGDFTQKITVAAKGEVNMLKGDINTMISALATERDSRDRALKELVIAREGAEAAYKAKSEFLANMSHEIRTPMNAILGLSQLCLQTGLDQRQHDYISKVNLSAQGLLGVINDILDFSKIDAGMLALELVHFDLSSSLQLLDSSVGHLARAKGLRFNMNVESDVPAYLVGDPLRLGQVLLNLASNAVKFTVEGEVGVSIKLKEQDGDSVVVEFEVSDTGIGLTPEQSKGMFLAFTQVDTSTTRKFGGTGLGLAISKRLVDLMGGTISLTSDVGTGSNFFFTARFSRGEANKAISFMGSVEEPAALWRLKGRRILVAEDNEFNQDVIREILEQCGVVVVLCNNGSEVLQCLASESYDMVLMDIQMPVMDGYEATRRIRATPSLADQCVIAMTANVMALDQQRCVACGMNDFVSKPIDSNFLYKTLLKWLPGEDQLPDVAEVEPIDLSVLGRLLNGDSVKTCKFAKKFLQSSRTAVVEMLAAQASGDLEMLSRLGHKHKSAAGSVGAAGLVELCSALEASSKAGDRAHVEKLLAQMPAQVDEIAKQLARQKDWN
jgi:PAS domain S-box-containing protein